MYLTKWKMTYGTHKDLPCTAPCSMYSVLLDHKIIDDPFYGLNERKYMHLSENGCRFECRFDVDRDLLSKEYIELTFLGLDTICDITLNGTSLDSVRNMHRAYTYDVKALLKEGNNIIELDFDSPVKFFEEMNNKHFLYTNEDTIPGAAHLRKALYMSGWDWGPTLPDMGIFRPVILDAYNEDKIDNVNVRQHHENGEVTLDIEVETKHGKSVDIYTEIDGKEILLKNGKGKIKIENPNLWWVRGYGEQYLYKLTVKMVSEGKIIDTDTKSIGLRTLTVSTEKDPTGSEFCFVINGVKIFSMGANYVPQDNLLSRINPQRTEDLIRTAVDANFNTIRIWGGGYYPEDEFYDICDKYGIMVWEDFMIACINVWLTNDMKKEFIAEAEYNIKRLRTHPSLALLCGNNEMEEGVCNWGIGTSMLVREDYLELYERIFPEICARLAPDVFYWQASPSSGGGFDDPTCETKGDVHYWKVWHGGVPFTEYRKHNFRFCSEYGFESFPSFKTIKEFCTEADMNCFSRVMENHQKCPGGNKKILMYMADNYLYPVTFETMVYASQLLQADAIKYGVEHFRRKRGYCMGSIYWQFNDCWPVASWSSIDSNLRYKALHYAAKKFYAPIEMGLFLENDTLTVNISNETMNDFEGEVRLYTSTSDFEIKAKNICTASVERLKSADVITVKVDTSDKYNSYVYADLYDKDGNFICRNTQLLTAAKHFDWKKPCIKIDTRDIDGGVEFSVTSNTFTKGVNIDFDGYDVVLSDNFFDITNENAYVVTAKTDHSADELEKAIKIMTVYDIGR
ncbi:MAG: glycoside hydrolase family 2 protein [Clostridia bacterium]|nr:glycoside hydrolase family 2 protein [Clostridia bacterium]